MNNTIQNFEVGEDVRKITKKLNVIANEVRCLSGLSGDGRTIMVQRGGGVPTISCLVKPGSGGGAGTSFSTPWTLELSGANIISKNAIANWYGENVLTSTEASPITWTAPAKGSNLYVEVSYSGSWSCVSNTSGSSLTGQIYLIGKYNSDGSITQYQHGVLHVGDRYQ